MKHSGIIIAGVVIFFLISIYYINDKSQRIEAGILSHAESALSEAGFLSVSAKVDGRHVTLKGFTFDSLKAGAAVERVKNISGVRKVLQQITVLPKAAPSFEGTGAELSIQRAENRILISGEFPDRSVKEKVLHALNLKGEETLLDHSTTQKDASIHWKKIWDLFSMNFIHDIHKIHLTLKEDLFEIKGDVNSLKTKRDMIKMMKSYLPDEISLNYHITTTESSSQKGVCQNALDNLLKHDPLLFDPSSDMIRDDSKNCLEDVAKFTTACWDGRLKVIGHSDDLGDPSENLELSMRRARKTATYLTQYGIKADRILTAGYGAYCPVVSNETLDNRLKNRRIEIVLIP